AGFHVVITSAACRASASNCISVGVGVSALFRFSSGPSMKATATRKVTQAETMIRPSIQRVVLVFIGRPVLSGLVRDQPRARKLVGCRRLQGCCSENVNGHRMNYLYCLLCKVHFLQPRCHRRSLRCFLIGSDGIERLSRGPRSFGQL